MAEKTMLYRIPPCPAYDIPGMEAWLQDMAEKGWKLCYDGFFWGVASFEKAPPEKLRFRLEATATNGGLLSEEYAPADGAFQLAREMGWDYRGRRGQFHIYSAADPQAPELNSDPAVQAMTLGVLGKYLRRELRSSVLMFLTYFLLYFSDMTLTAAVTLGSWRIGLLLGLFLWELRRKAKALARLSRLKRELESTGAFDGRPASRTFAPAQLLRLALWCFTALSLLLRMGAGLVEEDAVALEHYEAPLPFATLAELYPESKIDLQQGLLDSEVTLWRDTLAPVNIDYTEYAAVTAPDGTKTDCYLSVEYHETRFEWMAAGLAREFVRQSGDNPLDHLAARIFGDDPVHATELSLPGADYAAYYYKFRGSPYLVLQKDNRVLRVSLDVLGAADGREIQDLAALVLLHIG